MVTDFLHLLLFLRYDGQLYSYGGYLVLYMVRRKKKEFKDVLVLNKHSYISIAGRNCKKVIGLPLEQILDTS